MSHFCLSEYSVVFVWQVVVGVCLLCEAVQDRTVFALHFMCRFKNPFAFSLSLSFCFLSNSVSLSGLLGHLFQIPLSFSLLLFFYPFILTPGILCTVLFPASVEHEYLNVRKFFFFFLNFCRFL